MHGTANDYMLCLENENWLLAKDFMLIRLIYNGYLRVGNFDTLKQDSVWGLMRIGTWCHGVYVTVLITVLGWRE